MMYIGCGCLVHDGNRNYLLVEESKDIARGRMALPAGKLEANETTAQAAVREAREETGLQVEVASLLGIFHCPMTSEGSFGVNFVYAAVPIGGEIAPSTEHPRVEWLNRKQVEGLAAEGLIRGSHVLEAIRFFESGRSLPTDTVTPVAATRPPA